MTLFRAHDKHYIAVYVSYTAEIAVTLVTETTLKIHEVHGRACKNHHTIRKSYHTIRESHRTIHGSQSGHVNTVENLYTNISSHRGL